MRAVIVLVMLGLARGEEQGDSCRLTNGALGTCALLDKCPSALQDVKNGHRPPLCGFSALTPIICCPNTHTIPSTTTPRPHSKSEEMCQRYGQAVYRLETAPILLTGPQVVNRSLCGIPAGLTFVVGGSQTQPGEFPHMSAVGFGPKSDIKWMCGGTLISERYVLTAAHCLVDAKPNGVGEARWVRVGDLNLYSTEDHVTPQEFTVVERIAHPDYNDPFKYNDIGLLRVNRDAVFDEFVRPACLHITTNIPQSNAIATGWGRTEVGGPMASELQKVIIPLVLHQHCKDKFDLRTNTAYRSVLHKGIVDSMLCAGALQGGKDTCQGDSGGPLQIIRESPYCMYSVIGVTSFGKSCAEPDSPAVYTRVSAFVPWIESIVWK